MYMSVGDVYMSGSEFTLPSPMCPRTLSGDRFTSIESITVDMYKTLITPNINTYGYTIYIEEV